MTREWEKVFNLEILSVSCSPVYFWLGLFLRNRRWWVLKECLIFDFETKLHPPLASISASISREE